LYSLQKVMFRGERGGSETVPSKHVGYGSASNSIG